MFWEHGSVELFSSTWHSPQHVHTIPEAWRSCCFREAIPDVVGCFQWGAAVCVVGCSQGLGCHPHSCRAGACPQESRVCAVSPWRSLRSLRSSRAFGGGRMSLDPWPFAPGSRPVCCILSQACSSLWFIHIQMTY